MDHTLLGRTVPAPERYAPEMLCPLARSQARGGLVPCWQAGQDDWTGWELSWLEPSGMPEMAVMRLGVPAASPCLIESKSLKLYLNSLNATVFDTRQQLLAMLAADLSKAAGAAVMLELLAVDDSRLLPRPSLPGDCLDILLPEAVPGQPDAGVLRVERGQAVVRRLHSRLFRSRCPVTGQPDWASVCIDYAGAEVLPSSLLAYLLGYRQHAGFHEQCVEQIFSDIHTVLQPDYLRVSARFLRRGGLDINPWRSVGPVPDALPGRELRQ